MSAQAFVGRTLVQPARRAMGNDLLRHGALVFGATMLTNVLNYAFNFALSRRLGVEGYATLSSIVSGIMILSIPGTIVNLVVVKYAAAFHAAGDRARLSRLSHVILYWTATVAAVMFGAGVLLRNVAAEFLHIPNDVTITLSLAIMSIGFIMPSVRGILQGEQDFKRYSVSLTLEVFLKAALAVGLAYVGYGLLGAMGGWLAGTSLAFLYTVWAVRRQGVPRSAHVSLNLNLRHFVKTSAGVAMATSSLILLGFIDVPLVKHYFDAHQAGLYASVNLTGKVVLFLVGFLPTILLPKAVGQAERGESPVRLLLQAAIATIVMSGITLAIFGAAPARVISLVAGSAFVQASPFVLSYDAAMSLLAVLTLLVNYKIALHQFKFIVPLAAIFVCEVAAIATWHRSLWDVVHILLVCNVAAIGVCCFGLGKAVRSADLLGVVEA